MDEPKNPSRRSFISQSALTAAAGLAPPVGKPPTNTETARGLHEPDTGTGQIAFPRVFSGRHLKMLAFPLGGVGAGSVSLGGRGQLRDWEIFNRSHKGNDLAYALPTIWAQTGSSSPVARVLETRYLPPFEGATGLGANNAPGLARLASSTFTGHYPLASVTFSDDELPVHVTLEAFSPFIPHEPDDSGLPVAILKYRVTNPSSHVAKVSIAWSIDNPVKAASTNGPETRVNESRSSQYLDGLAMSNPGLAATDVLHGSFILAARKQNTSRVTLLRGWPNGRWWNSPLQFWDDFSSDGELGPEAAQIDSVGALCLARNIGPGETAAYEFILAWHFPNRTPARCGWKAPAGEENTVIGNWYTTRFQDAWEAADYAAANLDRLEAATRLFASSLAESTLPAPVLEAASANLSTLASTTCFRTADGEFHGFEGANDQGGCCFGNCTHVWNYETATAHLFPTFARSLRKAAFGYSMDDAGAMHFRQLLPDGKERMGFAAADAQMGQIVHAYLDWSLSGDDTWLRSLWPRIRKAVEFAWEPGGWDANRDGVLEGVQHNTYDVEFYGPNPQCGIYYLAALRAAEEMAVAAGDTGFATECRRLFENGSKWIDANLFRNGYYVQEIRPYRNDQIAASLRSNMGADDPQHPEYQVGEGCLVDQLVGQYLADVCGLGPLVKAENIRATLESIYKLNGKRTLYNHDSVQRTFALNDESALVICDYGSKPRPHIPFPYFGEVMTGFEYSTAAHMIYQGLVDKGVECIGNIRSRYDGERRNPWDEAECGHHYARAMAAWSGILAHSGFRYHAPQQHLSIRRPKSSDTFRCFWSTALGWGVFAHSRERTEISVHHGTLTVRTFVLPHDVRQAARDSDQLRVSGNHERFSFAQPVTVEAHQKLTLQA